MCLQCDGPRPPNHAIRRSRHVCDRKLRVQIYRLGVFISVHVLIIVEYSWTRSNLFSVPHAQHTHTMHLPFHAMRIFVKQAQRCERWRRHCDETVVSSVSRVFCPFFGVWISWRVPTRYNFFLYFYRFICNRIEEEMTDDPVSVHIKLLIVSGEIHLIMVTIFI